MTEEEFLRAYREFVETHQPRAKLVSLPLFVCPRCGARSAHPDDLAEGYCGACHDWTGVEESPLLD